MRLEAATGGGGRGSGGSTWGGGGGGGDGNSGMPPTPQPAAASRPQESLRFKLRMDVFYSLALFFWGVYLVVALLSGAAQIVEWARDIRRELRRTNKHLSRIHKLIADEAARKELGSLP
jgi:hypothetical protein